MAPREDESIYRLPPFYYMHVLDLNTVRRNNCDCKRVKRYYVQNVTRTEVGPKTYVRQDNERVVLQPSAMVKVPPRHYCVVQNPVVLDSAGAPLIDKLGQVVLDDRSQTEYKKSLRLSCRTPTMKCVWHASHSRCILARFSPSRPPNFAWSTPMRRFVSRRRLTFPTRSVSSAMSGCSRGRVNEQKHTRRYSFACRHLHSS